MPLLFVKRPFVAVAPVLYPLDEFANATAGWSIRPLTAAYAGNIIEVTSGGGGTQNIGRSGADLDTAALTSFLSGNNGFVLQMYEQSGSGNHMVSVSSNGQPQIATSGTIITTIGGKPTPTYDGTDDGLDCAQDISNFITNANGTILVVWRVTSINTANTDVWTNDGVWSDSQGFVGLHLHSTTPSLRAYLWDGAAKVPPNSSGQTIALSTNYVHIWRHGSSVLSGFLNSSTPVTVAAGNITTTTGTLRLGFTWDNTPQYLAGGICECLTWDTAFSDGDCASLGAMVADYYGVTWT